MRSATMPGRVDEQALQGRSRRMHELGAQLEEGFRRDQLGRTVDVLWESSEPFASGLRWSGLTDTYQRVVTETSEETDLHNRVTRTELVGSLPGAIYGRTPLSSRAMPETELLDPGR